MNSKAQHAIAVMQNACATARRELGEAQFQLFLEVAVFSMLNEMGIGAGSNVAQSGELAVIDLVRSRASGHCRIFDVGSNRGQFATMALERMAGASVELHCFEPAEVAFADLYARFSARKSIWLNKLAIGDRAGERQLYYDRPGSGLSSLYQRRLDHFGIALDKQETVIVDTIDGYCSRNDIDHIDLLKLDVEGHELAALLGASAMLSGGRIDFVSFEFGGTNIDSRTFLKDFHELFHGHGFRLMRITPVGYFHPIERYSELYEQFQVSNYLAARQ